MTTVDLFNTLEDLKEEEFVKFKWHLQQDVLEGYQPIKVSKLENAERKDTVDVMVNTYRLDGALKVAKKVLENINRNDLVQNLPDSSGPQDLAAASNVPEEEHSAQQKASSSSSEQQVSKPGQLIDPVENLEGRMCTEHDKPLELFCKTDQTVSDHKTHDVVPLKEKHKGKKSELGKTEAEIQQMIQKRRLKIQEIKHSVQRVQQYAVDVTLDPDTAHPALILSDDGKQVNTGDVRKKLPDNPERFSKGIFLLGKQSFSSGRFYFEVQVKRKTNWNLGVARESITRKGDIKLSPNKGYWTICLRTGNEYKALASPSVVLSLKSPPQKVGVFVDYEEGLVSFYDVDAAALIYSFTGCSFNEKLFPYFSPCLNEGGKNSAPLIISPVRVN